MQFTQQQINKRIKQYIIIHPEWLAENIQNPFNRWNEHQDYLASKAIHDNWLAIQSYEDDLAVYQAEKDLYEAWEYSLDTPVKPDMPIPPAKPKGYYTQEEVDESVAKWNEWKAKSDSFVPDEFNPTFNTPEPVVLQRPVDIPEPIISPLPDPIPNTPEPEFTEEELLEQRRASVRAERDTRLVEADIMLYKAFDNGLDTTPYSFYRQSLRDVPDQAGFPDDVEWPVKP